MGQKFSKHKNYNQQKKTETTENTNKRLSFSYWNARPTSLF